MSSLRTRLLAGVLLLAAAGLILLAAVTYAEQRSFLLNRVDGEVRAAVGPLSRALDEAGFRPASDFGSGPGEGGGFGPSGGGGRDEGAPGGPVVNLPPGTYGQRRDASGRVLGARLIKYNASEPIPSPPKIPASVPLGHSFTVGSTGSSGLHYRVYARRDPEDTGVTIAAVPLTDVQDTLSRLRLVEGLVIAGVLLALGLTAYFVVRLGLRPLDRIERTAGKIAAGDLSRRVSPADNRTEVGRLGLALNGMLERLEKAFSARKTSEDRLRQFLADASHELRTPLASIRGYAELYRMGAVDDPEQRELAMRRIEEEAKRMGLLVEDLLALARLDRSPEPRREHVDLVKLASDVAVDARATAPDREIALRAPEPAPLEGDPHQLHQVLANLVRNALVHTPPGSPIELGVAVAPDTVTVSVRDHGPGLPDGARERLFERFWRAEGGRERGRAGAGLGLAIAREIVLAHGGSIDAANAPGGGAIFTVELPH
jgi:two-component system OmpR family sensor kinase